MRRACGLEFDKDAGGYRAYVQHGEDHHTGPLELTPEAASRELVFYLAARIHDKEVNT